VGSQIYTRGVEFLARPLAEKCSYPTSELDPVYMCVKFLLSISDSSEILRGSQILRWGVKFPLKLVPHFGLKVHAVLALTDEGPS